MKHRLFISLIAGNIALAAISSPVYAANDAVQLDKIVVSATRTAQTLDQTIAPTIIIDRKDIERSQAVDAADLLRFHAGIDIGRNGGSGQATSVFIRGTESNHTLVLIDGVRINPGTIGGAAIQNIHPDLIERIEIVKGPRSVLYGSNAIGGVINIITRRSQDRGSQASVRFSNGRYNTKQGNTSLHYSDEALRLGLDLNLISSDGFPTRQQSDLDRGYNNRSINAYTGISTDTVDIELNHWSSKGNTEYLNFSLSPLDQDQINSVTTLKLELAASDFFDSTLKLSKIKDDIDQNQSNDFVKTDANILDWQNNFAIGNIQMLTAGVVLSRENNQALSFGSAFNQDTDTDDLYIQDQITVGNHQLILGVRHTEHSDFGGEFTWSTEYGIQINPSTRISASAGTAFRAPDATDRFGFGGNTNLDPERSRNIEIGMKHRINAGHSLRIGAFRNKISDLISFIDPDGFGVGVAGTNINVDEATIEGLELGCQGNQGNWNYSVDAIIQNPLNDDTNRVLARRAKRSLSAQVDYNVGKFQLGGDFLLTSRRNDSDFSSNENAGYLLVNTGATYRITTEYAISLKVENLFDKEYELADNFNTAGRGLFFEFRYSPAT